MNISDVMSNACVWETPQAAPQNAQNFNPNKHGFRGSCGGGYVVTTRPPKQHLKILSVKASSFVDQKFDDGYGGSKPSSRSQWVGKTFLWTSRFLLTRIRDKGIAFLFNLKITAWDEWDPKSITDIYYQFGESIASKTLANEPKMNEIKKGNRWDNRGQISKIKTKKCQKPANDSPRDVGEVGWKLAIQNWIHFYCEKTTTLLLEQKL